MQGHDCELLRFRVDDNSNVTFEGKVGLEQEIGEAKVR